MSDKKRDSENSPQTVNPNGKKILVTGAAGYIGSVLVRQLLSAGYVVSGFDNLLFGGESLLGVCNHSNFDFLKGDIRNKGDIKTALNGVDGVIHLAAIVGDPACSQNHRLAEETNWVAAKMLFDACDESRTVKHFVFASTCSNYGKMEGNGYVDEDSPLRPVSWYAELKVKYERYVLERDVRKNFIPCILRFSTAYGLSPRMRFDLTVNQFVRELTFGKELDVFGEQFWRPYCHVDDLARACLLVLESDEDKINHNIFGVGDTQENYQKKMIVEEILKVTPDGRVKSVCKDEDPRDYRVDFSKVKNVLGFEVTKRVTDGIREVHTALLKGLITNSFDSKYKNS